MELAACSWVAPGTSWGAKVGIQFAYSHSIRKMGLKSGLGESLTPFRLNGFECSWVLLGAPGCFGLLLGASGCSWVSSWVLLGSSWVFVGAPGAPGIPGVLLGTPGDPYKVARQTEGSMTHRSSQCFLHLLSLSAPLLDSSLELK